MSAAWQNRRPACLAGNVDLDMWLISTFGGGQGESAIDCGQQSDPMLEQSAANANPPGGAWRTSRTLGMPVVMAHAPLLLRSAPGAPHGARSEPTNISNNKNSDNFST